MTNPIFDKTDKGREEIATRKYRLAPRQRTLLLLVDGKHGTEELLGKLAGIGVNEQSMAELLDNGFICAMPSGAAQPPAEPATVPQQAAPAVAESGGILPEGETQFEAIYHFYTATIKSTVGLRGYALQLKVERAGSIQDFRDLRQTYLDAVQKAKGKEIARSLGVRLDQLLYLNESVPLGATAA
jgi:hypothetical protein